jgi:hypothetical protein
MSTNMMSNNLKIELMKYKDRMNLERNRTERSLLRVSLVCDLFSHTRRKLIHVLFLFRFFLRP